MARLTLEVLGAGGVVLRRAPDQGAVRIGRAPANDLVLADAEVSAFHVVLSPDADGRWTAEDLRSTNGSFLDGEPLARGTALRDGHVIGLGRTVRLAVGLRAGESVDGDGAVATTRRAVPDLWPYTVTVALDGPTGPFARVEDPVLARAHVVTSEHRAVLLYVLADQLVRDRARDTHSGGWCSDERIRTGVWGSAGRAHVRNNLNVLLRRTREELAENGFEGACIEKIHGHTRLRVASAAVR